MNKIKAARHKAGMTQRRLSEKSGVNIRQIQKAESGETSTGSMAARNLIAIADALGVHPRELLEDADRPTK